MIRGLAVVALGLLSLLLPGSADAVAKVPVIGFLSLAPAEHDMQAEAFRQGLLELSYVDGQNVTIEYCYADGREDRLPRLAEELVARRVDVIVALSPPALSAAMNATRTIPIVMRTTIDPVKAGVVASLAHPGGNVTGLSSVSGSLYSKRVELLKELLPGLSRLAVLWNKDSRFGTDYLPEVEAAARSLGIVLQPLDVRGPGDFADAFRAAIREHAQAVIPLRDPLIVFNRSRIADLALESGLPTIYDDREFVDTGGLISYGARLADLHRRAAYFVDKILRGAKPADLPVEQPTTFELIINLKTARALGLTVPPALLVRADEVIE
jgi:putative ABC transport system substrate-binding protein